MNIGLSVIQSVAMAIGFGSQFLIHYTWYNVLFVALIMTCGSAVLMWIGEQITEYGIGNGISIILLVNILSDLPSDFRTLYTTFIKGKNIAMGVVIAAVILALLLALVVFVVYLQDGERRIPGAVRQEDAGAQAGGRTVLPHPAEGQYRRRYPGHLRLLPAQLPGCDRQLYGI